MKISEQMKGVAQTASTHSDSSVPVLTIEGLHVQLPLGSERTHAVENVSYSLAPREILCVVGESGSGKSLTARAIMGLLPAPHVLYEKGRILFQGEDLTQASPERMRQVRGSEISMIFQEPMTALNPVMRIGDQIDEVIRFHEKLPRKARHELALSLLADVHLPDPPRIMSAYPHELSGGQRQRAMIAMALALEPKVLIADEPTTALDVTTQAQILHLIKELQAKHDTGVLFITHDIGVVADIADRVAVMQHGQIVEIDTVDKVLNHPQHEYTRALINAVPSLQPRPLKSDSGAVILKVNQLVKSYRSGGGFLGLGKPQKEVHACDHVDVTLNESETLGIVGESGSGKSTLARCIVRLHTTDSGQIIYRGQDLCSLDRSAMRPYRSKIQMVFQDPYASLNPRATVGRILTVGPIIMGESAKVAESRAREMLETVGLDARAFDRYPHEFSGGQRQRIGLARALVMRPEILVADEPVSALDVSIQAQVLDLLADIRERLQLSMVFITHDLRVAAQVCDRIAVMRLGKVVEQGPTAGLFENATHPYTRELLEAIPGREWSRQRLLDSAKSH
ncbi:ABC transporter ATP-binding protein [Granulosicoccus antarcticus]|uniref:ABC-type dipeptide transporter n=1 Tax=Granulosicoccus antarcticus IMCC3135 TaxID=1192854 RepID=A0A2Z2NVP5_9GAMM|nr:ABC transporter ATP-binding protein [Granulosicoccus antarcticus]ASJ75409.1 Glutathione import ATP-binding protein GsiA [Granulosicoccus antarcticus IMCC3135]